MRIGIVCPYAWDKFGGVQSHIRALGETLRSRGHRVAVIAPSIYASRAGSQQGDVLLIGRSLGIPANGSVAPLAFGPQAAASLRRALGAFGPEVLHLHEPLIPSLSLLALWRADVPMVGTFHASADSSMAYSAARPILRRAARKLAVRTAVSEAARELISRYVPGEYEITPNGVQTERFEGERSPRSDAKTVLFLGRLERRKGLEVLIQAMTRLRDLKVSLVVAGTGPEESACRRLALRLQVPAEFLGPVPEDDLPGLYRSADVYCAPGLGGESFGIVLVEAMAAGAPVVCSDLAGYRAVAGDAAILVRPGDAGSLADAIRRVLTDEEEAERMREASKRTARKYDWGRLAARLESVYERALSRSGG
ncbi:MAG: phosphatidyl-myo-inositol alpha-mannosyltransferase [Actinomycetota bacterium]|nr:phosphatidyl-myo-inositol alpha-mannosyltransferase [Actinomycetota bacterium]